MARTAVRRRPVERAHFVNGPWQSTRTSDDPLDSGPNILVDATNVFAPDSDNNSGFYARPGMSLLNSGAALVTQSTPFRGQGTITHTDLSNVTYNFVFFAGKMFREDAQFSTGVDVSPAGITIDPIVTTRVYGTSFANQLLVSDGVNRPWMATNLSSTPITGTYVDFDSAGTTWSMVGPMRMYAGSGFGILRQYNSVDARTDIFWTLPGDLTAGYQQTTYDFRWTLGQTEADPLYCLWGTNVALLYSRQGSIGAISGIPGPNLQSSHTDDSVSKSVGSMSPQTWVGYGTTVYFTDQLGRPYRLVPGSEPEPIWLQMRGIVNDASVGFSGVTKVVATAAYESTMTAYIVAVWSTIPSQSGPPVEGYIFEMRTGRYFARFKIADGTQIDTLGTFVDGNGRSMMVALGSLVAPSGGSLAVSGYVWGIRSLEAMGDFLVTEDTPGVSLVLEDDATFLTTEGSASANWLDNATVPTISITTPRFGYAIDKVLTVDRASALVGSTAPVTVSMKTAAVTLTVEGVPTPSTVQDDISRLTVGASGIQGRGVTLTLSPTTATSQWSVQSVSVDGILNNSPPDEG